MEKKEPSRRAQVEKLVRENLGKGPRLRGAGVTLESLENLLRENGISLEGLPVAKRVGSRTRRLKSVDIYLRLKESTLLGLQLYIKESLLKKYPPQDLNFWENKLRILLGLKIPRGIANPEGQYHRALQVEKKLAKYRFGVLNLGENPEPYLKVLEDLKGEELDMRSLEMVVVRYGVPSPWIDIKSGKILYPALKYGNLAIIKEYLKYLPPLEPGWGDLASLSAARGQRDIVEHILQVMSSKPEFPGIVRILLRGAVCLKTIKYLLEEKELAPYYLEDPIPYLDRAGYLSEAEVFVYLYEYLKETLPQESLGRDFAYSAPVLKYLKERSLLSLLHAQTQTNQIVSARDLEAFRLMDPPVISDELMDHTMSVAFSNEPFNLFNEVLTRYCIQKDPKDYYNLYKTAANRGAAWVLKILAKEAPLEGLNETSCEILVKDLARHNFTEKGFYSTIMSAILPQKIQNEQALKYLGLFLDIPNYYGGEAGLSIIKRVEDPFLPEFRSYLRLIEKSLARRGQSELFNVV